MALADYIYRLKPQVGDSTPHDEEGVSSDMSGGTITLVDAGGGDYCWQFVGEASSTGLSESIGNETLGSGVTMAIRFSVPSYDASGFAYLARFANSTAPSTYGLAFGQSGSNVVRARWMDTANETVQMATVNSSIRTAVLRFEINTTGGLDCVKAWLDGVGSGDTPDYSNTGVHANSGTLNKLFLGSSGSTFRVFDYVIWGEELSNADCAALADTGIRATLDTGSTSDLSGGATLGDITASGTLASQPGSSLSGGATLGDITAAGDMAPQPGVITTPVLKNNTGTVLSSVSGVVANIYHPSTGALVVRKTGLSSNSAGIVTITDLALIPGTSYVYEIDLSAATLGRRLPVGVAA